MLGAIAEAMSPGRNTNPAAAVIRAAVRPTDVIKATAELHLWSTQRVSGDRTVSAVCTLRELRTSHDGHAAFMGPVNDWIRELASGLVQELIIVPQDSAEVLFPTGALPVGDIAGVLRLLTESPSLGSVSACVPLLRRLLAQYPTDELLGRWRWATRYLLHGSRDLPANEDLFLARNAKEIWRRLAQAALAMSPGTSKPATYGRFKTSQPLGSFDRSTMTIFLVASRAWFAGCLGQGTLSIR